MTRVRDRSEPTPAREAPLPRRSERAGAEGPPNRKESASVDLSAESVAGEEDPGASLDPGDQSGNIGRRGTGR